MVDGLRPVYTALSESAKISELRAEVSLEEGGSECLLSSCTQRDELLTP